MNDRDDRDTFRLNQKANDVRESSHKRLSHAAMRDCVRLGIAGGSFKRVINAFDELPAESFSLLLVPLKRL
jgi:hypothetical protein